VYTAIAKHLYYPMLDRLRQIPFNRALCESERNQHLSDDELRSIQFRKLRAILEHAERNSLYYQGAFAKSNVCASDLKCTEDIGKFPLLDKSTLFHNWPRMRTSVFQGKLFKGTTSGSTGVATTFFVDSLHVAWVEACLWRGRRWWGVDRGERQMVMWARPLEGSLRIDLQSGAKYRLRNSMQFNTFEEFNNLRIEFLVSQIQRWRPALIYSYGSSLARLTDWMASANLKLAEYEQPKLVQYTADHMTDKERILGETVLGVPITSQYAGSECGGMAQECRAGSMHVSTDHALVEFLRADGTSVAPGEVGEIVVTTLHNFGMPLIRYRIGDLGAPLSGHCACGLTLPLMRLTAGKAVDLITTSSKQNVSAHLLDYVNLYLMKHEIHGVKQFLVDQISLDSFVLTIIRENPFDERAVPTFVSKMKEMLGDDIQVEVRFAESIPQESSGKRRYFRRCFEKSSANTNKVLSKVE